jgi:hypothetical protein
VGAGGSGSGQSSDDADGAGVRAAGGGAVVQLQRYMGDASDETDATERSRLDVKRSFHTLQRVARKSLEVSLRFLQHTNSDAFALLALLTLLPGGALEADLDAIWAAREPPDAAPATPQLPPPEVRLPVIPSKTEGALVDIERESSP